MVALRSYGLLSMSMLLAKCNVCRKTKIDIEFLFYLREKFLEVSLCCSQEIRKKEQRNKAAWLFEESMLE